MKNRQKYKKSSIPKNLRKQVWFKNFGDKLNGTCICCNTQIDCFNFEAAHIIAEKNGGKTNIDNLVPTCLNCNRTMSTTNLYEFKKKYYDDYNNNYWTSYCIIH